MLLVTSCIGSSPTVRTRSLEKTAEPASTKRRLSRPALSTRRFVGVEDMPECFSRPICRLAMGLNDAANEVERQQLIRFVTRLACADTPEIERERAAYIHSRTARHYTFVEGLQILEGALAIGRQAEDAVPEEVRTRMETVQRSATAESIADSPNFAKVKSWFATKLDAALSE